MAVFQFFDKKGCNKTSFSENKNTAMYYAAMLFKISELNAYLKS